MRRRLILLLVALAVLLAASIAVLRFAPAPSPTSLPAPEKKSGPIPAAAKEDPAGYDDVTVKIVIPPLSAFPAAWAKGGGCAHTRLSRILGAILSQGNGVIVFAVGPGKPAAKAGITPGDRLGPPEACPNTLVDSFAPAKTARTVKWTVRRPKTAALREAAAKEAKQAKFPEPLPAPPAGRNADKRGSGRR